MRFLIAILTLVPLLVEGAALNLSDAPILQSCSSLRNGLVGYWRLEEASGTRYDCSSSGNHLTDNNSVGKTTGKQGNCAAFVPTSNQYLSAASSNVFNFAATQPWTIAFWCKTTNTAGGNQMLFSHFDAAANRGYCVYSGGDGACSVYVATDGGNLFYTQGVLSLTNEAWRSVVITYDGSKLKAGVAMYVDNAVDTGGANAQLGTIINIDNTGTYFVGHGTLVNNYTKGLLDEIGVWTRVLTAAERTNLFNAGLGTHFPFAHK